MPSRIYTLEWAKSPRASTRKKSRQAAELWGKAKTSFLLHARGIEHHSKGVDNVLGCINLVLATGRIGNPIADMPRLQGRGMGKAVVSTATNATSCPAIATLKIWFTANTSPRSGASKKVNCPQGTHGLRDHRRHPPGRNQGPCCRFVSIRSYPCPTTTMCGKPWRSWNFMSASTSSSMKQPAMPTSFCQDRCKRKKRGRRPRPKAASSHPASGDTASQRKDRHVHHP
jgi:hypothetical protein